MDTLNDLAENEEIRVCCAFIYANFAQSSVWLEDDYKGKKDPK